MGVTRIKLTVVYEKLGGSLKDVEPATALLEEMGGLTEHFRAAFRQSYRDGTDRIKSDIKLQGFAPIFLKFRHLAQTVGALSLASYEPGREEADLVAVLVNGLERAEELAVVRTKIELPPKVWRSIEEADKPVMAVMSNVNGRLRDPATISVLHAFANAYFNLFGTNDAG